MTLQQLKYFVAIVRAGSFNAAAKGLHVSQPTLSQQIRVLETELGTLLFERGHAALALTPFGARVLRYAELMLTYEAAIVRESQAHQRRLCVRVGSIHGALILLLPHAIQAFHHSHPDVQVTIHEGGSLEVTHSLLAGELDFGIVADAGEAGIDRQFSQQRIVSSELVVCVPRLPMPISGSNVDTGIMEHYDRCPFITLNEGYLLHEATKSYLRRYPDRTIIYTSSTDSAFGLVADGVGIAILPKYVVTHRPGGDGERVLMKPLGPSINAVWNWIMIWNYDRVLDTTDKDFIAALTDAAAVGEAAMDTA
jgi:DNA-binding transcriptional LysR family regulator